MKGLQALEKLRQNNKDNSHMFDDELLDTIEKELKALEIIKNKFKMVERMYDTKFVINVPLTQEERDLLKEVLL